MTVQIDEGDVNDTSRVRVSPGRREYLGDQGHPEFNT